MKTIRTSLMCLLGLAAATSLITTACTPGDSVPLEDGHNDEFVRTFDIRVSSIHKGSDGQPVAPRFYGGYDASASVPGDQLLGAFYQRVGVKTARLPLGWQCSMTLDALFPNEFGDWESPDSYESSELEALEEQLVKHGVLPVWQAGWDIGSDGCTVTPTIGTASRTVGDTDLWAKVAAKTTYKLNSLVSKYYDATMTEKLAVFDLVPGYVEVLPDATGAGGYTRVSQLLPVYRNFINTLNSLFLADGAKPKRIDVIAPGLKVAAASEFDDDTSDINEFVDLFTTTQPNFPDIFSIKPQVGSLEQMVNIATAARARLDAKGMTDLPLAAIGTELTPDVWEARTGDAFSVENRSAFIGAFTASAYVRLQDQLKSIVPARWSTLNQTAEDYSGEDLFQNADGSELPALLMLSLLNLYSEQGEYLINVPNSDLTGTGAVAADVAPAMDVIDPATDTSGGVKSDPGDILSVLAAKTRGGGYQFLIAAVDPVSVIIDGKATARAGHRIKYVLNISDIPDGTSDWAVKIGDVDTGSSRFNFTARDNATVNNGSLSISGYITAPAVAYIKIAPPAAIEDVGDM